MKIFDIISGDEYEIPDEAIEKMDRQQEEYQRKIDEDFAKEKSNYIYNRDWIN